jgi:nicotinamidase-related amidase
MPDKPLTFDFHHTVDPKSTVLLVMNYQQEILSSIAEAGVLVSRLAGAITTVRRLGGQVGYVRVAFDESDYAAIPATNRAIAPLAGGGMRHRATPESAVHEDVAPQPGDIIVRKARVGAFSATNLDKQLHDRRLTTLILAGISTGGVVLSTVREAADRDYQVFVLADGSADPDTEVHKVLTQKILPAQVDVITIAELPGLLNHQV